MPNALKVRKREEIFTAVQPVAGVDGCVESEAMKGFLEYTIPHGHKLMVWPGKWVIINEKNEVVKLLEEDEFVKLFEPV